MNKQLNNLIRAYKAYEKLLTEQTELDTMERAAKAELASAAAEGPLNSSSAARKISVAGNVLATVNARREHVTKFLPTALDDLRQAYGACLEEWTDILAARGKAIAAKFYAALLPFYDGDEKLCRKENNHERLPAWNATLRPAHLTSALHLNGSNYPTLVGDLTRKIEKYTAELHLILT